MKAEEFLLRIDLQLFAEEEKTEEATPHKKRQVRQKGQVARSSDLNAALVILVLILTLYFIRSYYEQQLTGFLRHIFSRELTLELTHGQLIYLFNLSIKAFFETVAPVFAVAIGVGLSANFLQVGFMFAPEAIKPKLSNINPLEGFKRIFSKKALVEMLKAILKVSVVGLMVFFTVRNNFDSMLFMLDMGLVGIVDLVASVLFKVALGAAGIFIVVAILDSIYQKWEFKQRIKMSKYEVKQEFKQTEGDPLIRSKIKEKQRQLAAGRMMAQVPEATVVVTNPTHLALALKYEEGMMDAPILLAKGAGYVAQRIVEIANEHDVPVLENKPVARSLYQSVEIGEEIPVELYQAVAEILVALYRLKHKERYR